MREWNKIVREEKQRQGGYSVRAASRPVASRKTATGESLTRVCHCAAEILRVQLGKHADDNRSLRELIELRNTKRMESEEMVRRAEMTRTQQLAQEQEADNMVEAYYDAFAQLHVCSAARALAGGACPASLPVLTHNWTCMCCVVAPRS